jgi:5-methyltetrahydropteroyltriglutamate--homocysteine methyltransferase
VIAGTDCGFAQQPFYQRVHPTIQWAKLAALVEGARIASKELWARKKSAKKTTAKRRTAKPARRRRAA